ncbi:phage integrase SAM-like domain-containing protein [Empedobacter brevis]|uniref:phage integrase SAM-like domain-containing protein n=1 Tax=Empedobacter brevis TaxID=247 RepID=UPI0023F17927|nr:phage integrase SAM-like domain-containing protein [Empedobacter brevis]
MKLYYDNEKYKTDNLVKQKEYELVKELEFANSRNMNLNEAVNIIKTGIPTNDIEKRIIELEAELSRLKSQVNPTMLFDFSKRYIEEKKKRKELVRLHISALKCFKKFISPKNDIAINDIRTEMLIDFQNNLSQNMNNQSVNTYISKFQSIFIEAQKREELNIKSTNPFKNVKKLMESKEENKAISLDSIKLLMKSDLSNWKWIRKDNYQMMVDLFLFQIVIGGHDFIDIALLKWSNIDNGRIKFRRFKNRKLNNGGPMIDNKLFDFALEVIEKYGTKNNERVFSFIPFPDYENDYASYKIYQAGYNRVLTSIKNKVEISETILSKRARYTFNTIAGNLLINRDIIEELQGHSQSSISHGYYGGTFNEIKDAEHLKLLKRFLVKKKPLKLRGILIR